MIFSHLKKTFFTCGTIFFFHHKMFFEGYARKHFFLRRKVSSRYPRYRGSGVVPHPFLMMYLDFRGQWYNLGPFLKPTAREKRVFSPFKYLGARQKFLRKNLHVWKYCQKKNQRNRTDSHREKLFYFSAVFFSPHGSQFVWGGEQKRV